MFKVKGVVRVYGCVTYGNAVDANIEFDEDFKDGKIRIKLETSENLCVSYEELRNQLRPAFIYNKDEEEMLIRGDLPKMYTNASIFPVEGDLEVTIDNAKELYESLLHKGHSFKIDFFCPCD